MSFLFSRLFWGCVLIIWGFSLILEKLIGKQIPIGRFIIAFLLVYWGIYLIIKINKPTCAKIRTNISTEKISDVMGLTSEYSVVFGNNIIDISNLQMPTKPIEVNTVFGNTDLFLSEDKSYQLSLSTVFGKVTVPKHDAVNFGDDEIIIGDINTPEKIILVVNTVFGKTNIIIKQGI